MTYTLIIPGAPKAKARPRFSRGRAYTPKTTVQYERHVAECAREQFSGATISTACSVEVVFVFGRSGVPKKRGAGLVRHVRKPDIDNLQKSLFDGLVQGGVFSDDNIIQSVTAAKYHCEWNGEPRTEVRIEVKQ